MQNNYFLHVDRENILQSAYKRLKSEKSSKVWKHHWRIIFIGEKGRDEGGLRREFLTIITRELFDVKGSWNLFQTLSSKKNNVHPSHSATKHDLNHFEFAGKILAKCIYDTVILDPCLVNIHFSRSFYKQLLNLPIHFSDFEHDDPEYYLTKIKYIIENDIDDLELDLVFAEEDVTEVDGKISRKENELIPDGQNIPVTNANKNDYLMELANYRLGKKVYKQIQSFAKGFYSILPIDLVSIFDEQEMELLISGLPNINVQEMRKYSIYEGFTKQNVNVIQWFWAAVENFTEEEKARLIQFITGSSQVPIEGFVAFSPPITICRAYCTENLPTAHTWYSFFHPINLFAIFLTSCLFSSFNKIDIPLYRSYEELSKKLLIAITEGAEGFGFA